jgi:hypothetical protein
MLPRIGMAFGKCIRIYLTLGMYLEFRRGVPDKVFLQTPTGNTLYQSSIWDGTCFVFDETLLSGHTQVEEKLTKLFALELSDYSPLTLFGIGALSEEAYRFFCNEYVRQASLILNREVTNEDPVTFVGNLLLSRSSLSISPKIFASEVPTLANAEIKIEIQTPDTPNC